MANDYDVTTTGLQGYPASQTVLPPIGWAIASGTAQTLAASYTPANVALYDGLIVGVRALFANTGSAPTLNVDTLGPYPITRLGGQALGAFSIAGPLHEMLLRYNLANTRWELLNPADVWTDLELFKIQSADDTGGQNVTTAQQWFPTAGGVTVASGMTYFMDGLLWLTRSAGTTSHTTSILFAGTAVLQSIMYWADATAADGANQVADAISFANVATAIVVKGADTSATENIALVLRGSVRVTTGGTLIPQFQYSAAPGGTPTTKSGSYFRLRPAGSASIVNNGTWA